MVGLDRTVICISEAIPLPIKINNNINIPWSSEADKSRRPEKPVEDVAGDGLSEDHHPYYRLSVPKG